MFVECVWGGEESIYLSYSVNYVTVSWISVVSIISSLLRGNYQFTQLAKYRADYKFYPPKQSISEGIIIMLG